MGDTIFIRKDATQSDALKGVIVHELTHRAEMIAGNSELINNLVYEKPSVARRILNTIKDILKKLTGVKDTEIDQLRRVEQIFEDALGQAGEASREGLLDAYGDDLQYSLPSVPVDQKYFDNIDQHEDIVIYAAPQAAVPRHPNGAIDDKSIMTEIKNNPLVEQIGSHILVNCPDIDAKVELTGKGVNHGYRVFAGKNDQNVDTEPYALLSARAAMLLPDLLANAVEVNRSKKYTDHAKGIGDSHVLMSVYSEPNANGGIDYYAVRMMVKDRYSKDSNSLIDFEVVGELYAENAKKIPSVNLRLPQNANHLGRTTVSAYSIADLIVDVKNDFGDTFSTGAYQKVGLQREWNAHFSDHLVYSLPSDEARLRSEISAWMSARSAQMADASALDGVSQTAINMPRYGVTPKLLTEQYETNPELRNYKASTNTATISRSRRSTIWSRTISSSVWQRHS